MYKYTDIESLKMSERSGWDEANSIFGCHRCYKNKEIQMAFLLKDVCKKSGPVLWNEGSFESFIDGFLFFM